MMDYKIDEIKEFVRKHITYTEKQYITYSVDIDYIDGDNEIVYLLADKEIDGFSTRGVWECNICNERIQEEDVIDHFLYHKRRGDLKKRG